MTDNKIQPATCHGRCGRCRLESHTRGKGGRRGGASMGLWLLPSRGFARQEQELECAGHASGAKCSAFGTMSSIRTMVVELRMTLLDALREELALTATRKGCDRGECGACTVHVEGRRVLSCMTLAVMQEGERITTIKDWSGTASVRRARRFPMRVLYVREDHVGRRDDRGGKSGLAKRRHARRQEAVLPGGPVARSDSRTNSKLCRYACYPNIVDAVAEAMGTN